MKKALIGITGSPNSGKRELTTTLCEQLHMRRFNLMQPIISACAAITGIDAHDIYRAPADSEIKLYNTTAKEFISAIRAALVYADRRALIHDLEHRISASSNTAHFFNGTIVDGITSEEEAHWVRQQGGLVIHLHNVNALSGPPLIRVANEDYLCAFDSRTEIIGFTIPSLIDVLRERIQGLRG